MSNGNSCAHRGEVRQQWLRDITRRLEQLQRWGWHIVRVTSVGAFDDPLETLHRVHLNARERKVPGTPRQLSDDWRHHFTVRSPR